MSAARARGRSSRAPRRAPRTLVPAERAAPPERVRREAWSRDRPTLPAGDPFAPGLRAHRAELRRSLRLFEELRAGRRAFQDEVRACGCAGRARVLPSGAVVDCGRRARDREGVRRRHARRALRGARGLHAKLSGSPTTSATTRCASASRSVPRTCSTGARRRAALPGPTATPRRCSPSVRVVAGNADLPPRDRAPASAAARASRSASSTATRPAAARVFHHDCVSRTSTASSFTASSRARRPGWRCRGASSRDLAEHAAGRGARGALCAGCLRDGRAARPRSRGRRADRAPPERDPGVHPPARRARGAVPPAAPATRSCSRNHAWDDTCWHSVFALGERRSLAHSYGIFAVRRS